MTDKTARPVAAETPYAELLFWFTMILSAGAVFVAMTDRQTRERILFGSIYVVFPLSLLISLFGQRAMPFAWVVVLVTFISGALYSGDMGGGWAHGVLGGMTAANATLTGLMLLAVSCVRWFTRASKAHTYACASTDALRADEPAD